MPRWPALFNERTIPRVTEGFVGFFELLILAVGLSMDTFAISITMGLSIKLLTIKQIFIPGAYFGFFQALMPLIGYYAGALLANIIQGFDHWVAFILLGFIGGKMIKGSFEKSEENTDEHIFQFSRMLLLAIATSIDALAVGITFAFFRINISQAILLIGLTTFCISTAGVKIGNVFGTKYKSKAELAGGIILILLGAKILVEHLAKN